MDPAGEDVREVKPGDLDIASQRNASCHSEGPTTPPAGWRQEAILLVEQPLHGELRRAEMVDAVVPREPAEPDADVALERDVLVEVRPVPHVTWVDVAVQHHPAHPRRPP